MAWMLQPHSYSQMIRPNLYNVAYKRVGAYKGMGRDFSVGGAYYPLTVPRMGIYRRGLGQGCTDPTNPACVNPAGSDVYQIASGGELLPQSQYVGSTTPSANYLPWILGGVVLIALVAKR